MSKDGKFVQKKEIQNKYSESKLASLRDTFLNIRLKVVDVTFQTKESQYKFFEDLIS
jgi:hypothetical protein